MYPEQQHIPGGLAEDAVECPAVVYFNHAFPAQQMERQVELWQQRSPKMSVMYEKQTEQRGAYSQSQI